MSSVLAVDGGNFKTDLALVDASGELLALVRGARSSPHQIGVEGCVAVVGAMRSQALADVQPSRRAIHHAQIMVAGADLPEELAALHDAIAPLRWAGEVVVDNDTFALLRAGTDRGWGVAVVCGGGINCVGVAPDGATARFPALGPITGDWGGGYDVGMAALSAAARSADGRGPRTELEAVVPEHFGLARPFDVSRAVHLREIPIDRVSELSRVVFSCAGSDPIAAAIVDRLGDEVAVLALTALRRLDLTEEDVDVVLGGGLIRGAPAPALERIVELIQGEAPRAMVIIADAVPIVGATLLGLDRLGAAPAALTRARTELSSAFAAIEGDGSRYLDDHRAVPFGVAAPSIEAAMGLSPAGPAGEP